MAKVADTVTAMRSTEAARNNKIPQACSLAKTLCCAVLSLLLVVYFIIALVMYRSALKDAWYERPEFNLASLNASPPSALVPGDKVVVSGWVACFSTRNPNSEPISYDRVNALLWARCGRHDCQFDQADVTPFEQPPAVAGQVCASFVGDAVMKMGSDDKTVWFDAVSLNANITYKSDSSSLHVVCKDVNVVVSAPDGAVATVLDGGAVQCTVKRRSNFPVMKGGHYNRVYIVLCVLLGILAMAFITFLLSCFGPRR